MLLATGAAVLAVVLYVTGYWVEAEKEARILCAMSRPGTAAAEIDRMFGTANLLRLTRDTVRADVTLHVASPRNGSLTGCTVRLREGRVVSSEPFERFRLRWAAGTLAVITLLGWLAMLAWPRARRRWGLGLGAAALGWAAVVLLLGG